MTHSRHLTTLNLEPFLRNSIGVREFMNSMQHRIEHANCGNYPPYNIIAVDEDHFQIELAIAGFLKADLDICSANNQLEIVGMQAKDGYDDKDEVESQGVNYLHQGISAKSFRRSFALADYVEVTSAEVENGILTIALERVVPDALKPKSIEINFK